MLGEFDRGFLKRAEEKQKTLTGKGALVGGALGALPGLLLLLGSLPRDARGGVIDSLFNAPGRRMGGALALGGGALGAGVGGFLGSKAVAKKKEDDD
jgi:hypothetical protein